MAKEQLNSVVRCSECGREIKVSTAFGIPTDYIWSESKAYCIECWRKKRMEER